MFVLPTSIEVAGREFRIRNKGDFRVVLDCFEAIQDENLSEQNKIITALIIFYEDFSDIEDLVDLSQEELGVLTKKMFWFMSVGEEENNSASNEKLIDWHDDEQLICAAVNNVANMEIRAVEYMHWWTFMGYFMSIGRSALSTVVEIREKIKKGKKLEKWEKDFLRSNPQYFKHKESKTEKDYTNLLREQWGKGVKNG